MNAVSIYVTAAISASAAILGASISPITAAFQAAGKARRERQQQHETAVREECIALLRAAWELRTMVANNQDYHGGEMAARLAEVRERAAGICVQWVIIASLVRGELSHSAERVGTAAGSLAAAAAANTNLDRGVSVRAPEFGELDAAIQNYSEVMVRYWGDGRTRLSAVGQLPGHSEMQG